MNIISNINSRTFTLSAVIIGYILIDDSTPAEQNSLGNWFMLIGQILCTNSAQQQVINNKNNTSTNKNMHTINSDTRESEKINEIEMMKKVINALEQEINNIKKR